MVITMWILLSFTGLLFSSFDALGAFTRWRFAVVAVPEDERLIDMAKATMMNQLSNVLLFSIMLLMGLLSLVHYLSGAFPWLMFSINIVLVVSTIQQYRFRKRMYRESDREEEKSNPEWPKED